MEENPSERYSGRILKGNKEGLKGYLIIPGFAHPMLFASLAPSLGERHRRITKLYPNFAIFGILLHDTSSGRMDINREGLEGKNNPQINTINSRPYKVI
ncbi:MAG: hypothetical protein C4291_11335 [Candidatus Dadabacteria bacterium]